MTLMPEDVRNFLRELEIAYQDRPDSDENKWTCGFFLPTENYRFDNRGGFGTTVILGNKSDEGYGYLRLLVNHLYDTDDLSLENELLKKINKEKGMIYIIYFMLGIPGWVGFICCEPDIEV